MTYDDILKKIGAERKEEIPFDLVDVKASHKYTDGRIIVLMDGGIVTDDLFNPDLFDVKKKEGSEKIFVVPPKTMDRLKEYVSERMVDEIRLGGDEGEEEGESASEVDNTEVYKLVANIFVSAYKKDASDIHVVPDLEREGRKRKKITLVKFRIDGELKTFDVLPGKYLDYVVNKIKIMGGMDVSKKYVPQDGKIVETIEGEKVEFRVSTLYTQLGETAVLRLQRESGLDMGLEGIGFTKEDLEIYRKHFTSPYGMILNVGSTGQGKTTTFYLTIEELKERFKGKKKIATVEDPIERNIEGVVQHPVIEKQGGTYANILRALLRQDPDVIMVGEIRDEDTAGTAVSAALTGHMVLSTLHASDSFNAIPRLRDMGIHDQLIASTINCILSQRLVRKLCPHCKKKKEIPSSLVEKFSLDFNEAWYAEGCEACDHTGTSGRTAVVEVLEFDESIKEAIAESYSEVEIKKRARESGFVNLWEKGLEKVRKGIVSIEELISVIKPDPILNSESKEERIFDVRYVFYPERNVPVHVSGFSGYLFDLSSGGLSVIFEEPVFLRPHTPIEMEVDGAKVSFVPTSYGKYGKRFLLAGRYKGSLKHLRNG